MTKGTKPDLATTKRAYREAFHRNPTPGVTHLLEWIDEQRKVLHDKAEREQDVNISNNLSKEARGLYSVREHINSMIRDNKVTNRTE